MEEAIREAGVFENEYVKAWKAKSGKVVGYCCVATPVEIMEAAGILPYRIRALGRGDTEIADAHLSRFNCSFCRSCLQLGLDGTYDFLDGAIETNGCDHLRGMMENWHYNHPFPFFYYVKVPHLADASSLAYFEEELRLFRKALEEGFDVSISDEAVWARIQRHDGLRDKLRTVYQMREREQPALTGAEALSLFLLATAAPAEEAEKILDRVIRERENHQIENCRARLLLAGAATDEIEFVREIEGLGGLVVTDALCYGARAFWPRPSSGERGDPYRALAKNYLENLLCPRMFDDFPARREFVFTAAARARVDGAVLVHNKFCDVHGVDNVQLRIALEKKGIPVLQLEKEYGAKADLGRLKTRVQAFLERIGEKR